LNKKFIPTLGLGSLYYTDPNYIAYSLLSCHSVWHLHLWLIVATCVKLGLRDKISTELQPSDDTIQLHNTINKQLTISITNQKAR